MRGRLLLVSIVLGSIVVILPFGPVSVASAAPPNPPPQIAPIQGSDVGAFRNPREQAAIAKIGSDINALIQKLDQLPMYIVWGCADPSKPNSSLNRLWSRPDLQPPSGVSQPAPTVTFTGSGVTLNFKGGDWSHAIFLAPETGGRASERTLLFPAATGIGATCTPYFIVEPY